MSISAPASTRSHNTAPNTPTPEPLPPRLFLLEVDKYGPDESSRWKRVNACFPNIYKALLDERDRVIRVARLRQAVRLIG